MPKEFQIIKVNDTEYKVLIVGQDSIQGRVKLDENKKFQFCKITITDPSNIQVSFTLDNELKVNRSFAGLDGKTPAESGKVLLYYFHPDIILQYGDLCHEVADNVQNNIAEMNALGNMFAHL